MAVSAAAANAIYQHAAKAASGLNAASAAGDPSQSFSALLQNTLGGAVEAGRTAEATAAKGLTNKAELVDVVTAVTQAEMALETVVAVRDRVIAAYQDIMRMPI